MFRAKEINQEGYSCWLAYKRLEDKKIEDCYKKWGSNILAFEDTPVIKSAISELKRGIKGMLAIEPVLVQVPLHSSSIIIGITGKHFVIDDSLTDEERNGVGEEGFIIKNVPIGDMSHMLIAAKTDKGLLYGAFALLRLISTGTITDNVLIIDNPSNPLRIINHWDNMDGSIERGYAGKSIFFSNNRITEDMDRIRDYARLVSSVGINGVVINNVNVHKYETRLITNEYLPDVAKIAGVFRDYGIKLYLSINYASTIEIGQLETADPLDMYVRKWWKEKAKEIYSVIPDFGGFVVKADSEFRPGPFTYNRNHADGANMLAEGLKPYGGIGIWRCFVYNCLQDWRDRVTDRAKDANDIFKPLDCMFSDKVVLQIKC